VTVIKGFAETLIEDEAILTPEEKTRFLKKIRSNSERLHNLLQDLLLLTRLESTEMVLQLEDFSTGEFLQELTESWESVLEEGGQKLILDLCPGNDCVRADPLRLSQVMTNLLENAVRHARGFTEIRISTRLQDGGVVISVADDGVGIPEKDLPHVFQRFYRVEKGRSRESGGTGLGLSIVKHIVVQHGGEIRARSGKGRGTTIEVFLPAGART
jgi:signal transduction histidine kinase